MDRRLVLQSSYFIDNFKGSGPYTGDKGVATELKTQLSNNKLGRNVKLLAQLRELTPFLQDQAVFNEDYLSMLYQLVNQIKDSDNDGRKALRLVYYHLTEVIASLSLGGQLRPALLNDVYEAVLGDISSSLSCPPHRHLALRTAGILYTMLDDQRQPLEKLTRAIEDINNKCRAAANTVRPTGKLLKKASKEYIETTFLASGMASILRRLRTCPPNYLLITIALCCLDNDDANRGAFAALTRFMTQDPDGVSVHLHPKLRSTSEPVSDAPMTLTLRDTLGCVYYLRVCAHLAFVAPISQRHTERMRDDYYLTLLKAVGDPRLRVSLEAVRGLFGYGLQSYQRLAAMGLAAVEARQSAPPPLTKCREGLVAALNKAREAKDLPALHAILRVVLLVLRVLQEGNARCPASGDPSSVGGRGGTPVLVDFFAPQSPALHTTQPYGDEMKAIGKAVLGSEAGLITSAHACVRALALRILVWHAPPRTHVGSTDVWSSLRSRLCPAIDSLLDFQLSALLQDLLDRLELHREAPVTTSIALTVLSLAEHYFTRAPSDSTAGLVLKVWGHCLARHALVSAPLVLASIFAILDHNVTDVKSLNARSSSTWEQQGMSAPGLSEARSAVARLRRLALLFLRHYITSFPLEHMSAVLLRLQMLSLYADYHTRAAAVSALCHASLTIDNLDVKLSVYEFLHALEVAEFDLETCPDVKEEVSSLPVVQGQAVDYLDQASALCLKDIIAPTMLQLRRLLERLAESQRGGPPSLAPGPSSFDVGGMPPLRSASPTHATATSPVLLPPRVVSSPAVSSPAVAVDSRTMEGLLDFF